MDEIEMCYCCEVCHIRYGECELIAVEEIAYLRWERDYPWYICQRCADKISDALLVYVVKDAEIKHHILKHQRLKQFILTIPPGIWEDYKAALSKKQGVQVDEAQAEDRAHIDMFDGLMKTIHAINEPKRDWCRQALCDGCGACHNPACREYEESCGYGRREG